MFDGNFFVVTFLKLWKAVPVTLEITIVSLAVGIVLGFFIALARVHKVKVLSQISAIYVSVFRGTPIVLQILVVYSVIPSVLNAYFKSIGSSINIFDLNPIVYAFIVFGLNNAAGLSEVFRSALLTVNKGQFEAAYTQGFNYFGTMYYIILPQSIKIILPPMVNQVVNLIKNTSCLYIIGGSDLISLTYSFVTGASTGGAYGPAYLVCGVMFFIFCYPLSKMASSWENNLKKRDRMTSTAK